MHERELAYIKSLITGSYAIQMSPRGMYTPYEAGWTLYALIQKGEYALAKECLDELVTIRNQWTWNGYTVCSWYQLYYPQTIGTALRGAYDHWKEPEYEVDSGIAMPVQAMAYYDLKMGTTVYLTTVQEGIGFLKRVLQDPEVGLCNLREAHVPERASFTGDMAEVILALRMALDAYGEALNDSTGYSVKTFGDELVSFINTYMWKGEAKYFQTEYPLGTILGGCTQFPQRLTFTQAVTSWALCRWDAATWRDPCRLALDLTNASCMGNDGGYRAYPTLIEEDVELGSLYRYPIYTAFMVIAMKTVDATRYRNWINRGLSFIRMMTTPRGEVWNYIDDKGVKGIFVPVVRYEIVDVGHKPLPPLDPTGMIGYLSTFKILAETL